jgi:hypothetical protein
MMFAFDTVAVQKRASASAGYAGTGKTKPLAIARDACCPTRISSVTLRDAGWPLHAFGLEEPDPYRTALPKGLHSLRSLVFAFICLAERAQHAPEMQKPRTLCGAVVARRGFELVLIIN